MKNNSLINIIYNLPLSNRLPGFIKKIILKKNKITFIPTKMDKLPKHNYPFQDSIEQQEEIIEKFNKTNELSFNTFKNLKEILKKKFTTNTYFNFLDFGGEKLDFYLNISKEFKNINYFLINLPEVNAIIKEIKNKNNYNNLKVLDNIKEVNNFRYDFVYFGSTLQYLNDYPKYLSSILPRTKNYILISATHFYNNNNYLKDIVVKQLNFLPKVYYLYFFNLDFFSKFFSDHKFEVEFNQVNNTYHSNLTTFDHLEIENIKYSDILFTKKK